jgi:DNA-binding beta-propeller fold protein YncE
MGRLRSLALACVVGLAAGAVQGAPQRESIPTGQLISPLAAPGAVFQRLNPGLADLPAFTVDHAASMALSPDGHTLLILTSGFNRNVGQDGKNIAALSNEYVFVEGLARAGLKQRQVLQVPNTFLGIAWAPAGDQFYVSGGVDDDVIEYAVTDGRFQIGRTFKLGHKAGNGAKVPPSSAGLAVSPDGRRLLVANLQNDSVSLIDLGSGASFELDLRPGKLDPRDAGKPGGTFPRSVIWTSQTRAYVGTARDRELIALDVRDGKLTVAKRIVTKGQPDAFALGDHGRRLYVAEDNTDRLVTLDPAKGQVLESIPTAAPPQLAAKARPFGGAGTNALSLSPDGRTMYLSNGGENAVAVVRLSPAAQGLTGAGVSHVAGLIPTGWYPTAVQVSPDGKTLFVTNAKSNSGPNPKACGPQVSAGGEVNRPESCGAANQYVWQLEKAGLLTLPTPGPQALAALSREVAVNNRMIEEAGAAKDAATFDFLRRHIRHVIFVLKENRTYDQVLGDLEVGNGDPKLAILGGALSPNEHQLARQFVDLDNFLASGESSNTGWDWSTAARTNDFTERAGVVNYADRGLQVDQLGYNRNVDVALKSQADRKAVDPLIVPADPEVMVGDHDVAALDGPDGEEGAGYLWDSALRAGLTLRNYGFFGIPPRSIWRPVIREPWKEKRVVVAPSKPVLLDKTDLYYWGLDLAYPDYWRFVEWKREFDGYAGKGDIPSLMLVDLPGDHFGNFKDAIDGVNTVETQMADNDYALGLLIETVAKSRFAGDTLIFVVEDDAQDGADHVDSHRTISFVVGPYVKRHAVVSRRYTTVNLLRTMEEVLGVSPMGLNDAFAPPMTAVFDTRQDPSWSFTALLPSALRTTQLPLPSDKSADASDACPRALHTTAYWSAAMADQDFSTVDHLDTPAFNRALWRGLAGKAPLPTRSGRDLRAGRAELLTKAGRCRVGSGQP